MRATPVRNGAGKRLPALMLAFRNAPETSRAQAQNTGAELQRLKSLLVEAHGQAIAEAWHQAALNAFRAGMPDPNKAP